MIFQSNATDSEPSSHARQLIFHTCQANQWQGGEGMALMLLWGGPACPWNTKNPSLGCGVVAEAALAAVGTKRVGQNGQREIEWGEDPWKGWNGKRNNQELEYQPCLSQHKVIFPLLAPGGWSTPRVWVPLSTAASSSPLLWKQKPLSFHWLCSPGLICPLLMDNLSALGCSGSWEEVQGAVMPSA